MKKTIGIALSGGAVRGIAHLGVLQALEDNEIQVDEVSGASAGSLVGVLYASGYTPGEILEVFKSTSLLKLFKASIPSVGLTDLSYIRKQLKELLNDDKFSSLKIPFYVSVTNLIKGKYEIMEQGNVIDAVVASSSIPILFKAQQIEGDWYVDGGVLNNLPIEPLKKKNQMIIGVNVTPIREITKIGNLLEVGYRTLDLVMWSNVEDRLSKCDVVIEPGAQEFGFFELDKIDKIYSLGYEAAIREMPLVFQLIGKKGDVISKMEGIEPSEELSDDKRGKWLRRWWQKVVEFFKSLMIWK